MDSIAAGGAARDGKHQLNFDDVERAFGGDVGGEVGGEVGGDA